MSEDALLATLEDHTRSVSIVRWSRDGTMLASGGDDTHVFIYSHTPNIAVTKMFGSKSAKCKASRT